MKCPTCGHEALPRELNPGGGTRYIVAASFANKWKARRGVDYVITDRDIWQLDKLLSKLGDEDVAKLPECFNAYLQDEDPFVAKQGHSLAWFAQGGYVNRYRGGNGATKPYYAPFKDSVRLCKAHQKAPESSTLWRNREKDCLACQREEESP